MKTWGVDFEIDGTLEVHYARFDHPSEMTFAMMERHFNVTQAFVPLDGAPNVNVFAAPTDADDFSAIPGRKDMRAFYFDGGQGAMMWRGTWHSSRIPARAPNAENFDSCVVTEVGEGSERVSAARDTKGTCGSGSEGNREDVTGAGCAAWKSGAGRRFAVRCPRG